MISIKQILMERDGMSESEAEYLIWQAREEVGNRLLEGDMPDDICQEFFGLEPDYIFELL